MKKLRFLGFIALCSVMMSITGCTLFSAIFDPDGEHARERERKKEDREQKQIEEKQRKVALNYDIKEITKPAFSLIFKCEGAHFQHGHNLSYDERNKVFPDKYRDLFVAISSVGSDGHWYSIKHKTNGELYYMDVDYTSAKVYVAESDSKKIYSEGLSYENNNEMKKALNCYTYAADLGNTDAIYKVGIFHFYGTGGLNKSENEALKWYQKAADAGHKYAMFDIGLFYYNGLGGLVKNDAEALKWFRKAADAGHADAMYNIGIFYKNGLGGLANDDVEALKWFRKSADAGQKGGMFKVASCYYKGLGGLAKNDSEALKWFERAANAGDVDSMFTIGWFYENGLCGLSVSKVEALKWYQKAANAGDDEAKAKATQLSETMGQPTELGKTVDDMVASLIAHPEKKKLLNPIPISSFEYDIAKDSKGVIIKAYKGSVPAIVKIPETIEGIKVTEIIISNAFNNAQILVFPDTVNRIGGAMNGQKLKLILFPKNIKQIDAAFKYLQPSMNLILPEKLEVITYESFYGINIDTLTIPDSVTEIERYAFQYGKIGKLKLPNKLIKIGRSAFEKCQIKNLRLPNGLKVIGDYSFAGNPFVNLVIPESVEVIGSGAFVACENLENVTVSNKKIKYSSTSPYPSDSTYSTFWYCPPFYKCPSLSMKSKQAIRVTGYTYDF